MTDFDLCRLAAATYTDAPTWQAGDVAAVRTGDVIAFRGTEPASWADWLRDFDAIPVWDQALGWCHQGFLDGARAIWPLLDVNGMRSLTLTGHSMGGALAILTAAKLITAGMRVDAVVTFGAPRCGGVRVEDILSHTPLRLYRHGDDPVPDLPVAPMLLRQPGTLIRIGTPTLNPIADHFVSGYLAALAPVAVA